MTGLPARVSPEQFVPDRDGLVKVTPVNEQRAKTLEYGAVPEVKPALSTDVPVAAGVIL
jgi:hypothetical protein